ncbi:hemicentin-2-like [Pecten maximus]|uniref:hemicentin-2-like n=1 Tax=Pecten maximus TaxID=6579 RepID=UPI001457F5FA|nr:hemicentin-2-like [Pecten maximus]
MRISRHRIESSLKHFNADSSESQKWQYSDILQANAGVNQEPSCPMQRPGQTVNQQPPSQSVDAGSDIRLIPEDTHYIYKEGTAIPDIRCVADCNPTCEMSWYHDRTGHITTGSNLSLMEMERSKDGNYTCKATNSRGTRTLNLAVVSLFPPEGVQNGLPNPSYMLYSGDRLYSSITIDASPSPHVYHLYKGDDNAQHNETGIAMQRTRRANYRAEYSYSISNITFSDAGHYLLNVSNSQGTFIFRFSVNILDYDSHTEKYNIAAISTLGTLAAVCLTTIIVLSLCLFRKRSTEQVDQVTENTYENINPAEREDPPIYEMM